MAQFARVVQHIVTEVIITSDDAPDKGASWVKANLSGTWVQCGIDDSGNTIRKNLPVIDGTYDKARDAFIEPKPFESWLLAEDTCQWKPPHERPNDNNVYEWNEEIVDWTLVEVE